MSYYGLKKISFYTLRGLRFPTYKLVHGYTNGRYNIYNNKDHQHLNPWVVVRPETGRIIACYDTLKKAARSIQCCYFPDYDPDNGVNEEYSQMLQVAHLLRIQGADPEEFSVFHIRRRLREQGLSFDES